jgi:hypothetical protein
VEELAESVAWYPQTIVEGVATHPQHLVEDMASQPHLLSEGLVLQRGEELVEDMASQPHLLAGGLVSQQGEKPADLEQNFAPDLFRHLLLLDPELPRGSSLFPYYQPLLSSISSTLSTVPSPHLRLEGSHL